MSSVLGQEGVVLGVYSTVSYVSSVYNPKSGVSVQHDMMVNVFLYILNPDSPFFESFFALYFLSSVTRSIRGRW